jgi:hypothetical protein
MEKGIMRGGKILAKAQKAMKKRSVRIPEGATALDILNQVVADVALGLLIWKPFGSPKGLATKTPSPMWR